MKQLPLLLAALLATSTLNAQPQDILIEACSAMPDADKRLQCLKAAIGTASTTSSPKAAAIDTLAKAFGAMQAGIDIGMSYRDYQASLLELARAIAAFKQQVNDLPTTLIDASLGAYNDAGLLWQGSIEFYANPDNRAFAAGIPVGGSDLNILVGRYRLTTGRTGFLGLQEGLDAASGRWQIWTIAKANAEKGLAVLRNPPPPAEPEVLETEPDLRFAALYAKEKRCHESPVPEKFGESGFFYHYKVLCSDGTILKVACSLGSCKTLR